MIVVSDTSAVTSLVQVRRVHLLQALYEEVYVPTAVRDELLVAHAELPSFIQCVPVFNRADVSRLKRELDDGEAEAIVLAKQLRADDLLIDESAGRRVAVREGLHVIGLLGVLLEAKSRGNIVAVRPIVDDLERIAGFHVTPAVKALILREAGEL
jgi:uncharacterized protein